MRFWFRNKWKERAESLERDLEYLQCVGEAMGLHDWHIGGKQADVHAKGTMVRFECPCGAVLFGPKGLLAGEADG